MQIIFSSIAGLISGILGAMGMGGGGVLIIYLIVFSSMEQTKAQGINLIFFIPSAVIAIIMYSKKKLIRWDIAVLLSVFGLVGTVVGSLVSAHVDATVLRKLFGILLFVMAIKQFRS